MIRVPCMDTVSIILMSDFSLHHVIVQISPINMASPSPDSRGTTISVPEGHVALILLHDLHEPEEVSSFYLQIPLAAIGSLCLKPRKFLLFLGWCILGVEGVLALENDGVGIGTDGNLDDQGVYYYVVAADLLGTFLSRCRCCRVCIQVTYVLLPVQRRSRPCCRPRGHKG
jgi:hypothetical protein